MDQLERLLLLASLYAAHCGLSESTVSAKVLRGGSRLREIREGGDIGVRRISAGIQWFACNWPADLAWPEGVERPNVEEGSTK